MSGNEMVTNAVWTEIEFAGVDLKDKRLNKRCREIAEAKAEQIGAPINQACGDWASTKAAYRFFRNPKVTPEKIIAPHCAQTVERMKAYKVVLAVQDTTYFNYTHHPQTKGLGAIGNKKQKQRGFGMHSTVAVTPEGLSLGTLTQTFFTRPIGEASHKPNELRKQPIEEKESHRWIEALEQTLELAPAGTEVVTVCDREADIYEMFVVAQEKAAPLVVRARSDRCLEGEESVHKLRAKLERRPVAGELVVEITRNQSRKKREATVSIRYAKVSLRPPWRPGEKKLPRVTLYGILVREENPPEGIEEPIEWLLLTNVVVTDFDTAVTVVGWYCCRWQIEVFHKIIKSGCKVEDCRLETAARLQKYIALMCVVAWRLHWLTYLNRTDPDAPCTLALTTAEWQVLYMYIQRSTKFPDRPPTVHQAVRWIAQLGGFLAREADGEPGITVVWRGWQRLQDMVVLWELLKTQPPS